MKLLVVEDERELREALLNFFKAEGTIPVSAKDLFEAEDQLMLQQFDVVILDIGLPDGSGLSLLDVIRSTQDNCGVLILSAKNSLDDKIQGLDNGADDYLTKPFHLTELNSRVKALVRRKVFNGNSTIDFEEISINTDDNEVRINGENVTLTKKELSLLIYFVSNKDRVLTKESIAEHLWEYSIGYSDNYDFIYTHIKNLRKKIELAGGNDYLKTVHGIGYKYSLK